MRHEHDAAGRGAEYLCGGGWAARRAAVERSGTGREPPTASPWGMWWPEDASDNEPNFVLARGLHAVGDL